MLYVLAYDTECYSVPSPKRAWPGSVFLMLMTTSIQQTSCLSLFVPLPPLRAMSSKLFGPYTACLKGSSTAQHSTAQHSTAQHSTAQHSLCLVCRVVQEHEPARKQCIPSHITLLWFATWYDKHTFKNSISIVPVSSFSAASITICMLVLMLPFSGLQSR